MATPNTQKAFLGLVPFLKPQGTISIWVYADLPDLGQRLSDQLRAVTTKMNPRFSMHFVGSLSPPITCAKFPCSEN